MAAGFGRSTWIAMTAATLLAGCGAPAPTPDAPDAAPMVWPAPPQQPRIRLLRAVTGPQDWGIERSFLRRLVDALTGDGAEGFVRPSAVAQRDGVLYVADPGAQSLWLLDRPRGRYSRLANLGADALVSPVALAVRADGAVFVADTALKKVFLVDREGALLRTLAIQGLERPAGLAWDEAARRLYVLDSVRHRIAVFDGNGALLRYLGEAGDGDGQFNHPTHIALDAGGALLVTDALNFRVQALDRDGRFLWKFGQVGDGAGDFAAPKGIAADRDGNIYVVDAMFDAVQIFDRKGALLLGFGSRGTGRGQFSLPNGIGISADGRIYVADAYNRRVQVFARVPDPATEAGK